jgi:hypothetical protein
MKVAAKMAISLITLSSLHFTVSAQQNVRERDFIKQYSEGRIQGVEIAILLQQPNSWPVPVAPDRTFKQGERVKIGIKSNFRGYLYMVNIGSSGKTVLIFPDEQENNLLEGQKRYELPRIWDLSFDEKEGFETLQVFVSRQRITFLDAATKNPNGELSRRQAEAAAELMKIKPSQQAGIVRSVDQSRDPVPVRDPVWNVKKRATIVAIAHGKGPSSTAGSNPITAFAIRLRNSGAGK